MWPAWTNMLSWWQWLVLGAIPPAIVALYFLKLKRTPLEVPSTYLWQKSIEDLHVNSLWQRLRHSLLLFLQLLLMALVILSLLNPWWRGSEFTEDRYIFLIDNSASMQATDAGKGQTRLEEAKRRVGEIIDGMKTGDAGMIISFADTGEIEQHFTRNHHDLKSQLDSVQPTNKTTSLRDALRLAAGLANPSQRGDNPADEDPVDPQAVTIAPEAKPANLVVLSDFKFPEVPDFSLGNLDPRFELVGDPEVNNLAIVSLNTRRHEDRPDQIEVFARIANFGQQPATVEAELFLDGASIDAREVKLEGGETKPVIFETLEEIDVGVLRLEIDSQDAFRLDDKAWAVVSLTRQSKVLFVSPGNKDEGLWRALSTAKATELAETTFVRPEYLKGKQYQEDVEAGTYDLVIYDRSKPEKMPACNTLFIGAIPSDGRWKLGETIIGAQIIDTERTHPLMQLLELGDVDIYQARQIIPPQGGTTLAESQGGSIFSIAPREGFEDAVLGFVVAPITIDGDLFENTTWPIRRSFPVFVHEALTYLARGRRDQAAASIRPGTAYELKPPSEGELARVTTPSKNKVDVHRGRQGAYHFTQTDEVGVYQVLEKTRVAEQFAVNLFDEAESDIGPDPNKTVQIGAVDVTARTVEHSVRREFWKLLALLGLGVLLFEWYIYNRRVYL